MDCGKFLIVCTMKLGDNYPSCIIIIITIIITVSNYLSSYLFIYSFEIGLYNDTILTNSMENPKQECHILVETKAMLLTVYDAY
jgi:hypothetical protein